MGPDAMNADIQLGLCVLSLPLRNGSMRRSQQNRNVFASTSQSSATRKQCWSRAASTMLVLASLAFSACSGNGKYPAEAVSGFMSSCISQPGATNRTCSCALDHLQQTMPYDDFKRADTALRAGIGVSDSARNKLADAINACR